MKKVTKEDLIETSQKLGFEMSESEYDSFLKDFDILYKQFRLLSLVNGIDQYQIVSLPHHIESKDINKDEGVLDYSYEDNIDYLSMSILQLHHALLNKEITPLELTKLSLDKAKKDNNNAFEYICEKEALEQASNLDETKMNNLLWGIPYVLKDNFFTKDIPTTGSSDFLNGFIPFYDSDVYLKLKEQGAILIGKTTMDELAMGGTGSSGHLGRTFNPWDETHKHIIGGSSSGSASSCAAGIVPFAIGSDTGDSARKPASYANLVGFKPTHEMISNSGVIPFAPSLDTVGFFTRNVTDSMIVLSSLTNKNYSFSKSIKGLKIAIIEEIYESIKDHEIRSTFERIISNLSDMGAIINHVHMDINLCRCISVAYSILSNVEGVESNLSLNYYHRSNNINRTDGLSNQTKRRLIIGYLAMKDENREELLNRAHNCRHMINEQINNILEDNDAIYLPATIDAAPCFDDPGFDKMSDAYLIGDNYLAVANFGGQPSLTLPLGFKNDLPFGGNIIGRIYDEKTVLSIAKQIEDIVNLANILPKNYKDNNGKMKK